jgi:hypothetical protein
MKALEEFALPDDTGVLYQFPNDRPTLVAFVKEDCETCNLVLPALEALHRGAGTGLDVWVVSQRDTDIPVLRGRHGLTMAMLDDSNLEVSYNAALETVPSAFLYGSDGACLFETYGFRKGDWQALFSTATAVAGSDPTSVDWNGLPELKPGCGARNVEPGTSERLDARLSGKLRARLIDIPDDVDEHEFLFELGITDGLAVVPPTPERVWRMVQGTTRDPQEIVGSIAPSKAPATIEKVAVNAVMAGARPEYLPVILAGLEAACDPDFNLHWIVCTLGSQAPIYIVNGPVRDEIGMNGDINVLGQGNRANASIGRALQLVVRNVGRGLPRDPDRAAFGGPHKYTCCFPEREDASPWEPMHVERGFAADDSTVTVFSGEGPRAVLDQYSTTPEQLLNNVAWSLTSTTTARMFNYGELFLLFSPQHAHLIADAGWSKDDVRAYLIDVTKRPLRELVADDRCGEGMDVHKYPRIQVDEGGRPLDPDQLVSKFARKESLNIIVTGGDAAPFTQILGGFAYHVPLPVGNRSVTVKVGT